jgi:hypothetical protein
MLTILMEGSIFKLRNILADMEKIHENGME